MDIPTCKTCIETAAYYVGMDPESIEHRLVLNGPSGLSARHQCPECKRVFTPWSLMRPEQRVFVTEWADKHNPDPPSAAAQYREALSECPTLPECQPAGLSLDDEVDHPAHYTQHPSGVECIEITRHFSFALGNAIKYIWRAGLKTEDAVKDLRKAIFYLNDEIERLSE